MIVRSAFALGILLSAAAIVADPGRAQHGFEAEYARLVRSDLDHQPADVRESVRLQRESIEKSGIAARALGVGAPLPDFTLADASGRAVASDQLVAQGPVVVVFYRGAWDKFSRAYLRALEKRLPEIEAAGASLVAISADDVERTALMQSKAQVSFTLLSDPGYQVARRFGVVYEVPPAADEVMRAHGFNLARYYGTKAPTLPLSAAYVIDRHGFVIYASVPSDPYRRANPAELLSALTGLHAS
ncbi:MAG: peroxiredoxin-like family protein [Myxococcales bacterium]